MDDAQRQNEIRAIHELGGVVVWINRPGVESDGSATEQDMRRHCDIEIDNDGTLTALWESAAHIATAGVQSIMMRRVK